MSNIVLDKDFFYRRIKRLYANWKEPEFSHDSLQIVDCILMAVGVDEETIYSKSTSLKTWLLGYELIDTITVLCEKSIFFLTNKEKVDFLKQIEKDGEEGIPSVKLLVREKNDKDKANFEKLLEAIKGSKDGKTLGVFSKNNFPGEFYESWRLQQGQELRHGGHQRPNRVHHALQGRLRGYHHQTVDVFNKYLKDHIMEIRDAGKNVKHAKLSEGVEQALTDKRYVSDVDTNYLKFSAFSDKNYLHFGSIICALGARYKSYYSNVVRTLHYTLLLNLEEELLKVMIPGKKLSEVFDEKGSHTKTFGFTIGLEFREISIVVPQQVKFSLKIASVIRSSAEDQINFRFIPARSPNFGGLWESAVKSFKLLFKRTIGVHTLLYDEMQTILTQVEAVLNSRPLTPLSNDPDEYEALTSGHFLIQRPLTAIPEPDLDGIPENRLSAWQKAQCFTQQLWKK
ncbi:FACT complex subunit spt16-like [Ochlerotatus camptorhynchus]|uniref:FACT complex subunit spt16-like n=1 Tax=Ochlerotatus camptorhynchus TaxID=644619 RepID=UPI0031D6F702